MRNPRRRASYPAVPLGTLSGARRFPLRDYGYRGWELEPIRDEPSPREIVAALHRQIAALSPEHAVLVAEFEALSHPSAWDADDGTGSLGEPSGPSGRRALWRELRTAGTPVAQARHEIGVSRRTAVRYERWLGTLEAAS